MTYNLERMEYITMQGEKRAPQFLEQFDITPQFLEQFDIIMLAKSRMTIY